MSRTSFVLLACLGLLSLACEAPDPSGRRSSSGAGVAPVQSPVLSVEAQAKEFSAASRPGPQHKVLESLVGEWEVTLSTTAADGTESAPYRGRATLAWTLGQRFLRWDASLMFGEISGTTTGFLGFDTRTRQYQLMMISDFATGMMVAGGSGEIRALGIVFELELTDPATGARLVARSRLRILSPDHFVLEQLEASSGGKDRVTRISHYRRAGVPTR